MSSAPATAVPQTPARYPDAPELCDDVDQDCDGFTDESLSRTVGAPVTIAAAAAGFQDVSITAVRSGYGAVWGSRSGELIAQLLGPDGMPAGARINLGLTELELEVAPSAAHIRDDTILVTWQLRGTSGYDHVGRIVYLDEERAEAPVTLFRDSDTRAVLVTDDQVIVAYESAGRVVARAFSHTLAALGLERPIFEDIPTSPLQLARVELPEPYFLIGITASGAAQVDRVAYDPLASQGAPVRVGAAAALVSLSSTADRIDAVTASPVQLVRIEPGDFSSTLAPEAPMTLATDVDASRFGFWMDSTSVPEGTDVIWQHAAASTQSIAHAHVDRHGTASGTLELGEAEFVVSAAVARRTVRNGAILYTPSTTGIPPADVMLQRLGCD